MGQSGETQKQHASVTLRFIAEDACTFLKEEDVHVDGGENEVETVTTKNTSVFFGKTVDKEEVTTRVNRRVKEFHWKASIRYKLLVFPGTATDQAIVMQQRSTETVLVTLVFVDFLCCCCRRC